MRNVYKFLRASILILILVGGTYFIAQEYSAGIENAVNTSAGGQSLTKETITNLGDVLATVEAEIAGGAGSEKTNDTGNRTACGRQQIPADGYDTGGIL